LGLDASNRPRDVAAFLAVFGVLFVVMALAVVPARRVARPLPALLGFALLFRLLLVPAGLPAGGASPFGRAASPDPEWGLAERTAEVAGGLVDDLAGRRIAYRKHLLYDDDVWRYLWDGHVAASGRNPYPRSPDEIAELDSEADLLAKPWTDVHDHVGFPSLRTVYPPGAQLLFLLAHALAPASVVAWKLLLVAADLATCVLVARLLRLLGRSPGEAVLYAWNPLAIKEIAGSGHVDGAMVFLAVLAVERVVTAARIADGGPVRHQAAGVAALGASAAVKLGSAVLAPALLRATRPRAWWALPAVGGALCLPFLGGLPELARSLAVYGGEWTFNGGPWRLVTRLAEAAGAARPELWAGVLTGGALLAVVVVTALRVPALEVPGTSEEGVQGEVPGTSERLAASLATAAFAALGAAAWLAPAVMPWYLLWALPFAVATGRRAWVLLCALSLLSYLVYAHHAEHAWWLWLEHGGFAAVLSWEEIRRHRQATHARTTI
jgi:hypothetical protein